MTELNQRIANAVLTRFHGLPQKCKPRVHPDGRREWTPLAAVIVVRGSQREIVECVSLATGTKCLAAKALPRCHGTVLHDCHAEVLALRGFNRWLLDEAFCCVTGANNESPYLTYSSLAERGYHDEHKNTLPFTLRSDISLHMFTTEAPCGDASMEILMNARTEHQPWPLPGDTADDLEIGQLGRSYFSQLGIVRRKPSRGDASVSLSKSCTDKLSMKQFTSLLAFPIDAFVNATHNTFLKSLVVYANQFDEVGYSRAFSSKGRCLPAQHIRHQSFDFDVLPTCFPTFQFAKTTSAKPCNFSTLWVHQSGCEEDILEVLINGVKQGYSQFESRPVKESSVCRKQMWSTGARINAVCGGHGHAILPADSSTSYAEVKATQTRATKAARKAEVMEILRGWHANSGDDHWHLRES